MIIRLTICILLCMIASTAIACGDRPVYSTTGEGGMTVGLFLSDADFENAPQWSPGEGEPPISISRAVENALNWAAARYSRYDSIRVSGITLAWYRCSALPPAWYYKVDITPMMDGNDVRDFRAWVAVLFDGTTIGPREVK